jgi:hypothetical protein
MEHQSFQAAITAVPSARVSPLMLADRLLTLAMDADRSGLPGPAARLLRLAYAVYDEKPAYG